MGKIRGNWEEGNMKNALDNVLSGKMTVRQAEIAFSVPKSSLGDRIVKVKAGDEVKCVQIWEGLSLHSPSSTKGSL